MYWMSRARAGQEAEQDLYRGSARMMSVRGESVGEDCNVNCLGLKATENADWDLQSKRELVYVSVCV